MCDASVGTLGKVLFVSFQVPGTAYKLFVFSSPEVALLILATSFCLCVVVVCGNSLYCSAQYLPWYLCEDTPSGT